MFVRRCFSPFEAEIIGGHLKGRQEREIEITQVEIDKKCTTFIMPLASAANCGSLQGFRINVCCDTGAPPNWNWRYSCCQHPARSVDETKKNMLWASFKHRHMRGTWLADLVSERWRIGQLAAGLAAVDQGELSQRLETTYRWHQQERYARQRQTLAEQQHRLHGNDHPKGGRNEGEGGSGTAIIGPPLHQAFNCKVLCFPEPRNVNAALVGADVFPIVENGRVSCQPN